MAVRLRVSGQTLRNLSLRNNFHSRISGSESGYGWLLSKPYVGTARLIFLDSLSGQSVGLEALASPAR